MSIVTYVAIVEGDQRSGYSAFFPDLPGCVTGADTQAELLSAAREALSLHLQGMTEDGDLFPEASAVEAIGRDPDVAEVARILVDAEVDDVPVRVNISVGTAFLKRVDQAAEGRGMTRSGFLMEAARAFMTSSQKPELVLSGSAAEAIRRRILRTDIEVLTHRLPAVPYADVTAFKDFSEAAERHTASLRALTDELARDLHMMANRPDELLAIEPGAASHRPKSRTRSPVKP